MKSKTVATIVANEVAFHPRTQTRFLGPNFNTSWHCGCGEKAVAKDRETAIREHRDHVRQVVLDLLNQL